MTNPGRQTWFSILLLHSLFWLAYSGINAYLWHTFDEAYNQQTFYGISRLPVKMIAVYTNYYLLRRFFFARRYAWYFLWAFAAMLLAGLLQHVISQPGTVHYKSFTQYAIPIYSVVIFTSIYFIIRQYIQKVNEARNNELARVQGELQLLKTQLQPHFLFNTLNNIYALTMDDARQAGDSILRLSGILRYIIYDTGSEMVELAAEIAFLRQYVHLEQLRFGKRLSLSLNMATDGRGFYIPPMLLITFLENAFKHISPHAESGYWITIDLVVKENQLHYTVQNSTSTIPAAAHAAQRRGVGLDLLSRRLSLLYHQSHLQTQQQDGYYSSYLSVPSLTKKN